MEMWLNTSGRCLVEDEFEHDGTRASAWGAAAPAGSLGDWQWGLKQGLL